MSEPNVNTPNNGGPAFPRPATDQLPGQVGMTLRDWFAGQAVAGLVQFADAPTRLQPAEMAEAAYRIADALLAQRKKGCAS